jgi:hypothetical protein
MISVITVIRLIDDPISVMAQVDRRGICRGRQNGAKGGDDRAGDPDRGEQKKEGGDSKDSIHEVKQWCSPPMTVFCVWRYS